MMKNWLLLFVLTCLFGVLPLFSSANAATEYTVTNLQHAGAVYFDLEPGTFDVTVRKRDLPSKNKTDRTLKMFLFAPDGTNYGENILLSEREKISEVGEWQQMKIHANIDRAGVYMLLMSSPNREGGSYEWGFSTNAQKFVISSVAGHPGRDPDPIVLRHDKENRESDKPFSIFFKTPAEPFKIIASGVSKSAEMMQMYDETGKLIKEIKLEKGNAEESFTPRQQGVWELRLPTKQGRIVIDGVSRYWQNSQNALPVWTTAREHYFDVSDYYWLIHPRRFARDISAKKQGEISFSLANGSSKAMPLELSLDGVPASVKAKIVPEKVLLQPAAEQEIQIQYDADSAADSARDFYLIARDTNTGKQSFSHIELRNNPQKLGQNVQLPIEVELYSSQAQFAYEPDYPRDTQLYFDSNNRPWTIDFEGLKVLLDGKWQAVQLPNGNQTTDIYPGSSRNTAEKSIGTDGQGFVYAIVERDKQSYLLRVSSQDLQAQIAPLPNGGKYMIETYTGGGFSEHPPVVLRYAESAKDSIARWAKLHQLEMFIPQVNSGKLAVSDPVLISDNCIGMAAHSGMPTPAASYGDDVYIIWGATSDPAENLPGVPTYIATYNRKTQSLSKKLVAYSPPVNDVHNMSSILVDSNGGKHIIIGSHGKPFQYLHATPNSEEWTEPKKISDEEQTYVGAAFDKQGGITLFFRVWDRINAPTNAIFAYQRMTPDGKWSELKHFAKGPLLSYGVYYHRVTADRRGRIYVSFQYWTTWDNYRNSRRSPWRFYRTTRGLDRWVFSSADGEHWDLLRNSQSLKN